MEYDGGLFAIWVDIGLSPASMETTQTKKPMMHYTEMLGQNISRSLLKYRKHTQWVSASISVLVSLDLKAKVIRLGDGWQVNSSFRLHLLLAVKMIRQQISLTNRYPNQQAEAMTNSS